MQIHNKRALWHMTGVAAAVALVGCGGGSTVESLPSPTPTPVEYTLSGSAVKGPLVKAKVSVYKLTEDGKRGDKLGEGTSVAGGGYNIKYNDYDGPILVEVEATDETEMLDEATGKTVKPVGLKLSAALTPTFVGGARTLTVQVNPLTTNAVEDAIRKGGLTKEKIEQANKDLRESVGFDPLSDAPEFDENNKPKNKAGVMLAAISKLANDGDVDACKDKADQAAKIKCAVEELGKAPLGELKIPALQTKIQQVADAAGVTAPVVQPSTGTPVQAGAIAQAKALMANLRSNAKALDASDLSLQTEATALQKEVDQAVAPVVDSTFEMLRTMDFGAQLLEDAQNNSGRYQGNRVGTQYGAGCTVYTDAKDNDGNYTFATTATTKDNAKIFGCSSYITVNRNVFDSTTGINNTWRWRHRLLAWPKADAAGTYVVKTQARREYGTCQYATGNCGSFTQNFMGTANQAKPDPTTSINDVSNYSVQRGHEGLADFTRTFVDGNLTALKLIGTTAPSLKYQGFAVSPVLDNGNGRYHEVQLDVVKSEANGVQRLSLNGADSFIKFFSRNNAGETYFVSSIGVGKDSFIEAPADLDKRDGTEKFDMRIGFVAGNSAIRGQLAASDAKWDKSKTFYAPTKVTFGGRLERRTNGSSDWVEFLRGSLVMDVLDFANFSSNQPVSASNPQTMRATLNAVMTIPTRPVLNLNNFVFNSVDRGAAGDTVTMTGQYRQGAVVINLEGNDGSAANGHRPVVTMTSSEGIKLVYDGSKTVHPMTKNDVSVGQFNETTKRLDYADNTFEQF